ncbi:MAG: hypothetical protein ACI3W5_12745 [Faecousia sp.]
MSAEKTSTDETLLEVCDLSTLEAAMEEAEGQGIDLCIGSFSAEEWLINLQNHLIWGTIGKDGDESMSLVAVFSLCRVARLHGVSPYALPGRAGELAAFLLPERGV